MLNESMTRVPKSGVPLKKYDQFPPKFTVLGSGKRFAFGKGLQRLDGFQFMQEKA
jgi:hypothetical protein